MADGAARTLLSSGNQVLIDRAVPHLTTRDPNEFWTAGQWMAELTGGSDVGLSQTVAKVDEHGNFRLYGRKWFTSAISSQMALTLARPEIRRVDAVSLSSTSRRATNTDGRATSRSIDSKTNSVRKVPTAELTLTGTPAQLVKGTTDGVRNIAPLLNITRLWNGISAVALMRRAVALAYGYARKRIVWCALV